MAEIVKPATLLFKGESFSANIIDIETNYLIVNPNGDFLIVNQQGDLLVWS